MGDVNAIDKFLSSMGHNVKTATLKGRVNEYEETQSAEAYEEDENPDISTWIPRDENSLLEDLEDNDVYEHRNVGQHKLGFNKRSNPVKCDGCDRYTHKKAACLKETQDNLRFLCKMCAPMNEHLPSEPPQEEDA